MICKVLYDSQEGSCTLSCQFLSLQGERVGEKRKRPLPTPAPGMEKEEDFASLQQKIP